MPTAAASTGSGPFLFARKFSQDDTIQAYINGQIKSAGLNVRSQDILPDIQMNTIVTAVPSRFSGDRVTNR